jgi:hypothetical protein
MSAHEVWKRRKYVWRSGQGSDETVLAGAAAYLSETADWIGVRDWLIEMAFSKRQILDWFSENDFPDFQKAVNDGWGWPEEWDDDRISHP